MRRPVTHKQKEISLHIPVATFLTYAWPDDLLWTHFPAGEKRDIKTAAKLKAMGLKPGWSDFIFVLPNGQLGKIELKTGTTPLSDDQIKVRDKAIALGCGYAVCRSLDEVEATLTRWLAKFGRKLKATTRSPA